MTSTRRRSSARAVALSAVAAVTVLAAATVVAGCSSRSDQATSGRLQVVASFYPLQYIAERIGGAQVAVSTLTRPGVEPHDLELTPRNVAAIHDADLVVYLKGFQPAVDDAIVSAHPAAAFDAGRSAHLDLHFSPIEDGKADDGQARRTDPHFWLDPTRLGDVASALEQALAQAAPQDASTFERNLDGLESDLSALDDEYRTALASCANRDLVTSHNAFGYLADQYGLTQVGITGLTPDAEPGPRQLADVTRFVTAHHVHTIYYETLVSPAIAETIAHETGAAAMVLDPIEGLTSTSKGKNYLEVMRSNLATLVQGQDCQ